MPEDAPRVSSEIPHAPLEGTAYVVVSPIALIDCTDGWVYTVYQGGPVPANITPEAQAHLLGLGYIRPGKFVGGLAGGSR